MKDFTQADVKKWALAANHVGELSGETEVTNAYSARIVIGDKTSPIVNFHIVADTIAELGHHIMMRIRLMDNNEMMSIKITKEDDCNDFQPAPF